MRTIPRSMIQLAHENGAEIEWLYSTDNDGGWKRLVMHDSENFILSNSYTYRIANKTADGLRLEELLEEAGWDIDNIKNVGGWTALRKMESTTQFIFEVCLNPEAISSLSLVEPEPKMRPMNAQEMSMLPRGTAFVEKSSSIVYNPTFRYDMRHGEAINGEYMSCWKGYILPNESVLRDFEVEDK